MALKYIDVDDDVDSVRCDEIGSGDDEEVKWEVENEDDYDNYEIVDDEVDVIIYNSVGWNDDKNIDTNIWRVNYVGVYSAVGIEVERGATNKLN